MTFEEFQNRARLFVIGALYPQELEPFMKARTEFGPKAEAFVRKCHGLHEAFALSIRPQSCRDRLERRVISMARQHVNG
jgi:hypothetical protein